LDSIISVDLAVASYNFAFTGVIIGHQRLIAKKIGAITSDLTLLL